MVLLSRNATVHIVDLPLHWLELNSKFQCKQLRSSLMSSGQEKSFLKWLFLVKVCEYPRMLSHMPLKYLFHWQSCRVYFTALTYEGLGGDDKW